MTEWWIECVDNQLNMALILLSKVWSSKLSILMAWKYSLGSKYPLAIKKVCLNTSYYFISNLPWSWRHRSTWCRRMYLLLSCWPSGMQPLVQLLAFLPYCWLVCSSSSCTAGIELMGCSCLGEGRGTFLEESLEVFKVLLYGTVTLHSIINYNYPPTSLEYKLQS